MFKALASAATSAVSSLRGSPAPLGADHEDPGRIKQYSQMAMAMHAADIPVSDADCVTCEIPCEEAGNGARAEVGNAWDGKTYDEYVEDKYGNLEQLPDTVETDWESDLAGSGGPPVGRVVVISTAKSNWVRDHTVSSPWYSQANVQEEEDSLSYQINEVLQEQPNTDKKSKGANPLDPSTYIKPSAFPTPSTPLSKPVTQLPALYSSSMVSQSDDPTDQMTIVFPDWKVCLEVENSRAGAQALWDGALSGKLGRAGRQLQNSGEGVERRRSWVLPYRAIVLLCKSTLAIGSDAQARTRRATSAATLLQACCGQRSYPAWNGMAFRSTRSEPRSHASTGHPSRSSRAQTLSARPRSGGGSKTSTACMVARAAKSASLISTISAGTVTRASCL